MCSNWLEFQLNSSNSFRLPLLKRFLSEQSIFFKAIEEKKYKLKCRLFITFSHLEKKLSLHCLLVGYHFYFEYGFGMHWSKTFEGREEESKSISTSGMDTSVPPSFLLFLDVTHKARVCTRVDCKFLRIETRVTQAIFWMLFEIH